LWRLSGLENWPRSAHIVAMDPKADDIDKQGGWLARVQIEGGSDRFFKVYELDKDRAVKIASVKIPVTDGEKIDLVSPLNMHDLTGDGMKPGDVKQHG
jgi:hypothetical protein